MQLRDYQTEAKQDVKLAWECGIKNACMVLPTGAGKTVVFSNIVSEEPGHSIVVAHRQELVSQICLALARNGVTHRIIAPQKVIKTCIKIQMRELGRHYFNTNAKAAVASVDTMVRRGKQLMTFLQQVQLWVIDECHHVVDGNKWGKAVTMCPNARGLGVTATPVRADGQGLGRHAEGVFDTLVIGPSMRELIERKSLTDYKIYAPPSDIQEQIEQEKVGSTGDWSSKQLKSASKNSHIIGDVVDHYLRIAPGKLGVTFTTDVETAHDVCIAFRAKGVPAEVLSAKTPDDERFTILDKLRRREILQLVNVDICGEGFDLPAIEVVSMARPTQSYGLYAQQFGRALRLLEGKEFAIIIDHVGNVIRHGLPDKERFWSLDGGEKRPRMQDPDDDIPLRYCMECTAPYERIHKKCPYCGTEYIPAGKAKPELVDGDLTELDPATLEEMRGEKAKIDASPEEIMQWMRHQGRPEAAVMHYRKHHLIRQAYQQALRESMAWWAAYQNSMQRSDSEAYRRFYFTFGIDVLSAQGLGTKDALKLANNINEYIARVS